ncbi:MAG: hydrogenase maturation nickel metallochaperone HypA [Propionibacteriaceae bacterium]|nr:hydrogenase maturation nickel metallochaperone HypA [Propionibacteriaceae bacterium]
MHEYPITCSIIETALEHAGNARVTKIALVIGEASGIDGESIQIYFEALSEGTPCEGAVLEIESVSPMLRCVSCGALFERKPFSFDCDCGGIGAPTEIGKEMHIQHIEVESP